MPDYWEILGTNSNAEIFRFDKKRGHIHYAHPAHQRLVKAVDWYDESGRLRVTDHYNNKGVPFLTNNFTILSKKRPLLVISPRQQGSYRR